MLTSSNYDPNTRPPALVYLENKQRVIKYQHGLADDILPKWSTSANVYIHKELFVTNEHYLVASTYSEYTVSELFHV